MRYDDERGMLVATAAELAGAANALGIARGPLSTTLFDVGDPVQAQAFEDGLARLGDEQRDIFETALPVVCDPARSALVHAFGDAELTRRFLAWGRDGAIVAIEQLGGELGLRALDPEQIRAELLAVLDADTPFVGADTRLALDARSALALAGTADAFRREWLGSLLDHTPSRTTLAAWDIAEAIAGSATDDPRWASCLLDKVLPAALRDVMDGPTTELALRRLAEAGVLAVAEGEAAAPALFAPTEDGAPLLQGLAGGSRMVAVSVYGPTESGAGYESLLFARDPVTVWTLMLSGDDSFVASTSPTALGALLDGLLGT